MILIASAAYVNSEFQIEFGKIPPAFLPVGNRRLFEWQIEVLSRNFPDEKICLTLPESFNPSFKDLVYLEKKQVDIICVSESLSLADSIAFAMSSCGFFDNKIRLLHGDTLLLQTIPLGFDIIGVVETSQEYQWEVESVSPYSESVWCGYFSFGDAEFLLKQLLEARGSFVSAVKAYSNKKQMRRSDVESWLDFGHINTYFKSRAAITTERAFNSIVVQNGVVTKTGLPRYKIQAEAEWFKNIPTGLKIFTPQFFELYENTQGSVFYTTEYLHVPPLNEIFVHGRNQIFYWDSIFIKCSDFLVKCSEFEISNEKKIKIQQDFYDLVETKTWERINEFFNQIDMFGLDTDLTINGANVGSAELVIKDCLGRIFSTNCLPGILHGDFCLSNILYDSRSQSIKIVDPRGIDAKGDPTIWGDLRYDLAKLTHSILGLYDHILAGAFEVDFDCNKNESSFNLKIYVDQRVGEIQKIFTEKVKVASLKPLDVLPLSILLFFSMLPLHRDNFPKQMALFANALRLYNSLDQH